MVTPNNHFQTRMRVYARVNKMPNAIFWLLISSSFSVAWMVCLAYIAPEDAWEGTSLLFWAMLGGGLLASFLLDRDEDNVVLNAQQLSFLQTSAWNDPAKATLDIFAQDASTQTAGFRFKHLRLVAKCHLLHEEHIHCPLRQQLLREEQQKYRD